MDLFRALHSNDHDAAREPSPQDLPFGFPEKNPNPVLTLDREGRLLYANPAARRFAESDQLKSLLPEQTLEAVARSLDTGQSGLSLEARLGERVYSLALHPDLDQQSVNIYAVDITDRVNTQERLQLSEERFRALFEGSAVGIALMDADGVLLEANPALMQMAELTLDDLRGASLMDFVAPGDAEPLRGLFQQVMQRSNSHAHMELRLVTLRGRSRWGRATLSRTRVPGREQPLLVAVIEDIEEHKQLQQQVRQSQKVEAVGLLAGGVAHDFNNILAAILGHAELALMKDTADSPEGEVLRQIVASADRGRKLTRQLLAFSRRQVLEPKVIDLGEVVGNLEKMLARLIGPEIRMSCSSAEGLWAVRADPGQIEQVVMNLTVNARDAMAEGGELSIHVENVRFEEETQVTTGTLEKGEYVDLSVHDTGTGISDELLSQIFDPFFTTKEEGRGTGLGLSTVFGIVQQSGGQMDVRSRLGQGSRFRVLLPRSRAAVERQQPLVADHSSLEGSESVLVLERNREIRELIVAALERHGYQVDSSGGEREAVEICTLMDRPVQLIISDLSIPGIRGPSCMQRLRELSPEVQYLFLTGFADPRADLSGEVFERSRYLHKPFHMVELLTTVRSLLDDPKAG